MRNIINILISSCRGSVLLNFVKVSSRTRSAFTTFLPVHSLIQVAGSAKILRQASFFHIKKRNLQRKQSSACFTYTTISTSQKTITDSHLQRQHKKDEILNTPGIEYDKGRKGETHETIKLAEEMITCVSQNPKDLHHSEGNTHYDISNQKKLKRIFLCLEELKLRPRHVLGLSADELQNRYDYLFTLGLTEFESLSVALSFPATLTLENSSVIELVKLFRDYHIDLQNLFLHHPYMFAIDYATADKNLKKLLSYGWSRRKIGDIINNHPLLLCYGFNESVSELCESCNIFQDINTLSLDAALKAASDKPSVIYQKGQHFKASVEFLEQLDIKVSDILMKSAGFLNETPATLCDIMNFLTGPPLFFEVETLHKFILKHPEEYLGFKQESVKEKLHQVQSLLSDDFTLYGIVLKSPFLFTVNNLLLERYLLLQRFGFGTKHIAVFMKYLPSIFDDRKTPNLEKKLEFLLTHEPRDLTVANVMSFPQILVMRFAKVYQKISYIRRNNINSVFQTSRLSRIILSNHKEFSEDICTTTHEDFKGFLKELRSRKLRKMLKEFYTR